MNKGTHQIYPQGKEEITMFIINSNGRSQQSFTMNAILGRNEALGCKDLSSELVNCSFVSRVHATINEFYGKLYICDLGSKNGTYVNNKRIPEGKDIVVTSKDIISLGGYAGQPGTFTFILGTSDDWHPNIITRAARLLNDHDTLEFEKNVYALNILFDHFGYFVDEMYDQEFFVKAWDEVGKNLDVLFNGSCHSDRNMFIAIKAGFRFDFVNETIYRNNEYEYFAY